MVQKPQDGQLGPQVSFFLEKQEPYLRLFLKSKVAHSISIGILYLLEHPKSLKLAKTFLTSREKCLTFKGIAPYIYCQNIEVIISGNMRVQEQKDRCFR